MLLTLSGLEPCSGFKLRFWSNLNLCNYTLFTVRVFFPEISAENVMKKLEKRNNETSVNEARARYIQRKLQRQQSKAP